MNSKLIAVFGSDTRFPLAQALRTIRSYKLGLPISMMAFTISNDQHIIEDNGNVRFVTAYDTDYYVSNMM